MTTCDIKNCSNEMTIYGRWIGYCQAHSFIGKKIDRKITWENEIGYDLKNGNMKYIENDSELQDVLI